jgi:hypothetical protein
MPTPNCAAASCRDKPPLMTAFTTRSRREDHSNTLAPSMLASFPASMLNQK